MDIHTPYSPTEWNIAVVLIWYVILDFMVRVHSTIIALKERKRITEYYTGWMTVELYKEWFMFVRWNRIIAYIVVLCFLYHVDRMLLFSVLSGKFILEVGYHLFLKCLSKRLL